MGKNLIKVALFGLGRGGGGDRKLVIIGLDSGLKGSG